MDTSLIEQLVPAKYWFVIALLPYIGRGYQALKSGGGLRGLWRSIWLGVSTDKPTDTKPAGPQTQSTVKP